LGASSYGSGVNFSVYSRDAVRVDLLLFDGAEDPQPARVIPLDPTTNRTFHYWHVYVPGISSGQVYAYRAHGPFEPQRGLRFDGGKVLLDPYGRGVVMAAAYDRGTACLPGDNTAFSLRSVVVDPSAYNWEGDRPFHHPFYNTVIYEMHAAGFTRHPNSGVDSAKRGTYAGLIEKIPYLQSLGITAVELLPVFAFDPFDAPLGRQNYWGYSPISFFAPHPLYSQRRDPLGPVDEFRDMVKALHRAGIEVILDVVFNHTAEGGHTGPTLCFRGLANDAYYILEPDRTYYLNYTGTGNTLNANNPIVRRMIVDSLRYWVAEMHVDGFRFDLASILSRDEMGIPLARPPILWDIDSDPYLAGTKLIAEAWDAAGLYQVGSFAGDWWKEWNGRFRDDVRAFVKGERGSVEHLPDRLLASPDLYGYDELGPDQSVNFVTCHDGFTLNDLVSYNQKHNEANGEGNRDGSDSNLSWNHGVEGPSSDPEIERLRERQIKNFFTFNLISMGVSMLLMGDEVRRTQLGNNNAYSQDNDLSWFDWSLVDKNAGLLRFVRMLIQFCMHEGLEEDPEGRSLNQVLRESQLYWHGVRLYQPDWRADSHSLALTAIHQGGQRMLHLLFNAYWEPLTFELPVLPPNVSWQRRIDTGLDTPEDICASDQAPAMPGSHYTTQPRSVVALVADLP